MTFSKRLICLMLVVMGGFQQAAHAEKLRVVSIDGSITEIIYALDAAQDLVGVDTTSVFPEAASKLPNVGYMRHLSGEGILSLAPDLVIVSEDAGPKKVLDNLQQAGLTIQRIPSERSVEGVIKKVERIAQLLHREEAANALIDSIRQEADEVKARISSAESSEKLRVMFLMAAGGHGSSIAGKGTSADAIIQLMGAQNVVTDFNSYKPLSQEGAIEAAPDIIVLAERVDRPLDFDQYPALKLTPAYLNNRIVRADSMLLLGFGPRIAEAMSLLADAFYPSNSMKLSAVSK